MNFTKIFATLFLGVYATASFASTSGVGTSKIIKMKRFDNTSFEEPVYYKSDFQYEWKDKFSITTICDKDNFPFSSIKQGSIFAKIFDDLAEQEHIVIAYKYPSLEYKQSIENFEKGIVETWAEINGVFGVYYKNAPYSQNEYIYPAFFENKVHIIMSANQKLNINNKADLDKYRGGYSTTDYFSDFVLKDFASLKMQETESFAELYKKLLTGELDYIAASYYTSMIELYKLGIRDYVVYSKTPLWKMPMFLRTTKEVANSPRINEYRRYIKSERYKKIRDEAFEELLDIYRRNTKGVVPPTYINKSKPDENIENDDISSDTDEEYEETTLSMPLNE